MQDGRSKEEVQTRAAAEAIARLEREKHKGDLEPNESGEDAPNTSDQMDHDVISTDAASPDGASGGAVKRGREDEQESIVAARTGENNKRERTSRAEKQVLEFSGNTIEAESDDNDMME